MNPRSQRFLDNLKSRVLVCDGAMGTVLYSKGISANRCFEELNLSMPSLIKEVHEAYIHAGADIVESNTFGANALRLLPHGLREKCAELNRAGVELARQCAGEKALVAGAVGPLGVRMAPIGSCTLAQARAAFEEQIRALAEGGADLILLETFYDLSEIREALAAAKAVCDLPVVAQVTITEEGTMLSGPTPETAAEKLAEWGADVVGCNCSVGPQAMLGAIQRMSTATERPLSAQPNAGLPTTVGGRNIYLCSPDYMARYVTQFIKNGVKIAGGCCGTTPEHIRAIRASVSAVQAPKPKVSFAGMAETVRMLDPFPLASRSSLAAKIANGEFVTIAEVLPPKGCDAAKEIEGAQYLAQNGIDAVYVPDSPRAGARMSAQAMGHLIQAGAGIEVLLQYSCRNRNLMAIQSDLLGSFGLGLKSLLLTTGDAPPVGHYPDDTPVFDVDALGLTKLVENLNQGLDVGGNFLGNQTGFLISVFSDPGAMNFEQEVERTQAKIKAGAECIVTRPVFDPSLLEKYLDRIRPLRIPVILSIWPLTSFRNAEYLANERQMILPLSVLERLRAFDSGEQARKEGIQIAREMALWSRDLVQGILVSAPLARYDTTVEVIGSLRPPAQVAAPPASAG